MDRPGGKRRPSERNKPWREVDRAIRAYADCDTAAEADQAFELARERLQAAARAWVASRGRG